MQVFFKVKKFLGEYVHLLKSALIRCTGKLKKERAPLTVNLFWKQINS